MDGVAIVLSLVLVAAMAAYITWPWWARRRAWGNLDLNSEPTRKFKTKSLTERREALLTTLRDLDFDHAVGTISPEDYEPLRNSLLVEVASIMTQLDQERAAVESHLDAHIEAQVLAARQTLHAQHNHQAAPASFTPNAACPTCGRASRLGDVYCTGCGTELDPACPQCGMEVKLADSFCRRCGAQLAVMSGS